jgi:hypothetical protein
MHHQLLNALFNCLLEQFLGSGPKIRRRGLRLALCCVWLVCGMRYAALGKWNYGARNTTDGRRVLVGASAGKEGDMGRSGQIGGDGKRGVLM